MPTSRDPFRKAREKDGVSPCDFQGERVPMILRHVDVRAAAKDWGAYSSDAPFRVPIPSEEEVRTVRQLPIEVDPPDHTDYRKIVEPFFRRAKLPEVVAKVDALIGGMLDAALGGGSVEIVQAFALPIQSRALTYLLDVPESEADVWIGWGTRVFRVGGSPDDDGRALERYLDRMLDRARARPGEDFFSALTQATFRGRKLTREEMHGFANLAFAGGRDTVINTVAGIVGHFAEHPDDLEFLRADPQRIVLAGEEFFRTLSTLTHIGRVCPVATDVGGFAVPPAGRVSLCWASANHDADAFDAPEETRLDRKPNPHLAFGAGAHLCLGATHARLIVRTLLRQLIDKVGRITLLAAEDLIEHEAAYQRRNGYESLEVEIAGIPAGNEPQSDCPIGLKT